VAVLTALPLEKQAVEHLILSIGKRFEDDINEDHKHFVRASLPGDGCQVEIIVPPSTKGQAATAGMVGGLAQGYPSLDLFVFAGIAGGIPGEVERGQVVVSDHVIASDPRRPGPERVEERLSLPEPEPQSLEAFTEMFLRPGKETEEMWQGTWQSLVESQAVLRNFPDWPSKIEGLKTYLPCRGTIASGEAVLYNPKMRDDWYKRNRFTAFENEGAAVATTSFEYKKGYLVIRGVSDFGEAAPEDQFFRPFSAHMAAAVLGAILRKRPPRVTGILREPSLDHELGRLRSCTGQRLDEEEERLHPSTLPLAKSIPYLGLNCRIESNDCGLPHNIDGMLDKWVDMPDSNFAIIFAPFGSGKSRALVQFSRRLLNKGAGARVPIYLEYPEIASEARTAQDVKKHILAKALNIPNPNNVPEILMAPEHLDRLVVILDSYDDAFGLGPPHLSLLRELNSPNSKLIVSCRRFYESGDDELVLALRDPAMVRTSGLRNPLIAGIEPLDTTQLTAALEKLPDDRGKPILDYFSSPQFKDATFLFNPLLIQMLVEMDIRELGPNRVVSIGDFFDRFTDVVSSKDIITNLSRIPGRIKLEILTNIAGDIFSNPLSASHMREGRKWTEVAIRVMEAVSESPLWMADQKKVNWVHDFITTNHMLVSMLPGVEEKGQHYRFFHHTLYEYFLAAYFVTRMSHGESLGIHEGKAGSADAKIFDSLVMSFLRHLVSRGGPELRRRLASLVRRENLSNPDRLLLNFLLEDEPGLMNLAESSSGYMDFLLRYENSTPSLFLRKVIKYQLILAASDVSRAFEYVDMIKGSEGQADTLLEQHTFMATSSPSEFLLARFRNPKLISAKPISIYRLGQFGDSRAVAALKEELEALRGSTDPNADRFRELIACSIKSIAKRSGVNSSLKS
jgi:nucleoside phosphorylase